MDTQLVSDTQEHAVRSNEPSRPESGMAKPEKGELSPLINGIIHDAKQLLVHTRELLKS